MRGAHVFAEIKFTEKSLFILFSDWFNRNARLTWIQLFRVCLYFIILIHILDWKPLYSWILILFPSLCRGIRVVVVVVGFFCAVPTFLFEIFQTNRGHSILLLYIQINCNTEAFAFNNNFNYEKNGKKFLTCIVCMQSSLLLWWEMKSKCKVSFTVCLFNWKCNCKQCVKYMSRTGEILLHCYVQRLKMH